MWLEALVLLPTCFVSFGLRVVYVVCVRMYTVFVCGVCVYACAVYVWCVCHVHMHVVCMHVVCCT